MSKVLPFFVTLDPSPSADVVGYRMYYEQSGAPVTYDSPYVEMDSGMKIDLSQYSDLAALDGVFDVEFTAIDDAGNESDLGAGQTGVPFDFTAPLPPSGAVFSKE